MSKSKRYREKLTAALKKLSDVSADIESVTTEFDLTEKEVEILSSNVDTLVRKLKSAVRKKPEKLVVLWEDADDDAESKKAEPSKSTATNSEFSSASVNSGLDD
jgi:chromosome segregation ATPase